jgi:hypothetical protein
MGSGQSERSAWVPRSPGACHTRALLLRRRVAPRRERCREPIDELGPHRKAGRGRRPGTDVRDDIGIAQGVEEWLRRAREIQRRTRPVRCRLRLTPSTDLDHPLVATARQQEGHTRRDPDCHHCRDDRDFDGRHCSTSASHGVKSDIVSDKCRSY